MNKLNTIENLEELLDYLISDAEKEEQEQDLSDQDWASLPNFGGMEPENTEEIWSWDETRLLVGSCASDLEIVERAWVN